MKCQDTTMENREAIDRKHNADAVADGVARCTACELGRGAEAPVPFQRPIRPLLAVLGEAPRAGPQWVGIDRSGDMGTLWLRRTLTQHGIKPEANVAWVNTISCDSQKVTVKMNTKGRDVEQSKPRPPDGEELVACRGNMLAQLDASHVPVILLTGATAVHAFRPDLTIKRINGNTFLWDKWVVVPTYSPEGAVRRGTGWRSKNKTAAFGNHGKIQVDHRGPEWEIIQSIKQAVETVALLLGTIESPIETGPDEPDRLTFPVDPPAFAQDACAECSAEGTKRDPNHVPYCDEHWHKGRYNYTLSGRVPIKRTPPKGKLKGRKSQVEDLFDGGVYVDE